MGPAAWEWQRTPCEAKSPLCSVIRSLASKFKSYSASDVLFLPGATYTAHWMRQGDNDGRCWLPAQLFLLCCMPVIHTSSTLSFLSFLCRAMHIFALVVNQSSWFFERLDIWHGSTIKCHVYLDVHFNDDYYKFSFIFPYVFLVSIQLYC